MQKKIKKFINKLTDYLVWVALAIMVAWAFLKLFGVLESPAWQETIPIFTAAFILGKLAQSMQHIKHEIGVFRVRQNKMAFGLVSLEKESKHLNEKFTNFEDRFASLENKFDRHISSHA